MTREEVAEIINYCQTNQITYKARLQKLGIPTWRFYESKAKYAEEEASERSQGSFLQMIVSIRSCTRSLLLGDAHIKTGIHRSVHPCYVDI